MSQQKEHDDEVQTLENCPDSDLHGAPLNVLESLYQADPDKLTIQVLFQSLVFPVNNDDMMENFHNLRGLRAFNFLARKFKSSCSDEDWETVLRDMKRLFNDETKLRLYLNFHAPYLEDFLEIFPELICWRVGKLSPLELCFANRDFSEEKLMALVVNHVGENAMDKFQLANNASLAVDGQGRPLQAPIHNEVGPVGVSRNVLTGACMDAVAVMCEKIECLRCAWDGPWSPEAFEKFLRILFCSSTTTVQHLLWYPDDNFRFHLQPELNWRQKIEEVLGSPTSSTYTDDVICPLETVVISCEHPMFPLLRYMPCLKDLAILGRTVPPTVNDWDCLVPVVAQGRELEEIDIEADEMPAVNVLLPILEATRNSSSLKTIIMYWTNGTLEDISALHQRMNDVLDSNTVLTKVAIHSKSSMHAVESEHSNKIKFLCHYNRLGRGKIIHQDTTVEELMESLDAVSVIEDRRHPFSFAPEEEWPQVPVLSDSKSVEISITYSMLLHCVGTWIPKPTATGKRKRVGSN